MQRAVKIRLLPTKEQEVLFWKSAGTARWAYNYFLEANEKAYKEWLENGACFTGTYPRLTPYCGQPGSRKPVITGFLDLKTFKRVSTCFEYF